MLVLYEEYIINLIDTYDTKAPKIKLIDPSATPFCAFTNGNVRTPAPKEVVTRTKIVPLSEPL